MSVPPPQEAAPIPAATVADPAPPPPQELAVALTCFDRGDFAGTRTEIKAALAAHPTAEVQQAARALVDRMAADPWALRVGVGAFVLLLIACNQYLR